MPEGACAGCVSDFWIEKLVESVECDPVMMMFRGKNSKRPVRVFGMKNGYDE